MVDGECRCCRLAERLGRRAGRGHQRPTLQKEPLERQALGAQHRRALGRLAAKPRLGAPVDAQLLQVLSHIVRGGEAEARLVEPLPSDFSPPGDTTAAAPLVDASPPAKRLAAEGAPPMPPPSGARMVLPPSAPIRMASSRRRLFALKA